VNGLDADLYMMSESLEESERALDKDLTAESVSLEESERSFETDLVARSERVDASENFLVAVSALAKTSVSVEESDRAFAEDFTAASARDMMSVSALPLRAAVTYSGAEKSQRALIGLLVDVSESLTDSTSICDVYE